MLLWDDKTRWSEGVNEFGVAILNSATAVKKDEKEASKSDDDGGDHVFYSPDGKIARQLLFEKTVDGALNKAIELELIGNSIIFSKDKAYLLEGAYADSQTLLATKTKDDYKHKYEEISKDKVIYRTNHGVWIDNAGYQYGKNEHHDAARKSSEERYKQVGKDIKKVENAINMLDCISNTENKNPQLNPLRLSKTHGKTILVTTGQIMLIPGEKTLYYRPIWCEINFNFNKIDSPKTKTYFEIISSRKILGETFKQYYENSMS